MTNLEYLKTLEAEKFANATGNVICNISYQYKPLVNFIGYEIAETIVHKTYIDWLKAEFKENDPFLSPKELKDGE